MPERIRLKLATAVLHEAYRVAEAHEMSYEPIRRSVPLNVASDLEKINRELLFNREAAQVSHDFFLGYAIKNNALLTAESRRVIGFLADIYWKDKDICITELRVPETGNLLHHSTIIDIVSFYPEVHLTRKMAETIAEAGGLERFTLPQKKGKPGKEYWSLESQTRREVGKKSEFTRIKIRQRRKNAA